MPISSVRFAIIGVDHSHWRNHARMLIDAGAELASYYADKAELVAEFGQLYPDVPLAPSMQAILDDETIQVIAGAPMPADRAPIAIAAMRRGKDVMVDKPGITTPEQLAAVERAVADTGWRLVPCARLQVMRDDPQHLAANVDAIHRIHVQPIQQ